VDYHSTSFSLADVKLNPTKRPTQFIEDPIPNETLGILLLDFLNYYGDDFPYESFYISVTQGALIPKEDKGWVDMNQPQRLAIECLVNPG